MHASIIGALVFVVPLVGVPVRAADEPDELVPGHLVVIKDAKVVKFVAKPPTGATFDLPDATNDPTSEGGQLDIFDDDPSRPVRANFALQASRWTALGSPAGSKGYKYRGAGSASDPCRVVVVKAKVVKVLCRGTGVILPTPFTGQLGIVLTVGADSKQYCASFGGDETTNDPTLLRRRNAPAPNVCPLDLNSSTTMPPTTSTSSTTSTTLLGPVPCCAWPSLSICAHGPMDCAGLDGVPGDPGSRCDSVTGACLMMTPNAGHCCDIDREPGDEACGAGPNTPDQCMSPNAYVPNAICSSNTPSVCLPGAP